MRNQLPPTTYFENESSAMLTGFKFWPQAKQDRRGVRRMWLLNSVDYA
jgi:hypothetical protein